MSVRLPPYSIKWYTPVPKPGAPVMSSVPSSVTLPATSNKVPLGVPSTTSTFEVGLSASAPMLSVAPLAPARVPPFCTVTAPPMLPEPVSVAPLATLTGPAPIEPATLSVPALTLVAPP